MGFQHTLKQGILAVRELCMWRFSEKRCPMIYSSVDRELLLLVFLLCLIHKPGIRCAGCSTNIE